MLLSAVIALGIGCKDDNGVSADSMPVPTKSRPPGFEDVDTGKRPNIDDSKKNTKPKKPSHSAHKKPGFSSAELKGLRELLPKLSSALVLDDLTTVRNARVATMSVCLPLPLTKASSRLVRAFREAAWTDIELSKPTKNATQRQFSANTKTYRLTASLIGGTTIGCPKPETHTKVAFRMQERQPAVGVPSKAMRKAPAKDTSPEDAPTTTDAATKAAGATRGASFRRKALNVQGRAVALPAQGTESPPPAPQD